MLQVPLARWWVVCEATATGRPCAHRWANFSAVMTVQHLPKTIVFGATGFVFQEWLGLIVLMVVSGAVGTWLGLKIAHKISNRNFGLIFNLLLTALALRLVWQAWHMD